MQAYMTKPRKRLLAYLQRHPDEALSAGQISQELDGISVSAVYRNLSAMENEGSVRRVSKNGSREVFYQYLDAGQCREHIHLSCKKCGKTFHMDAEQTEALVKTIAQLDRFAVDRGETVLYGVCENCQTTPESAETAEK